MGKGKSRGGGPLHNPCWINDYPWSAACAFRPQWLVFTGTKKPAGAFCRSNEGEIAICGNGLAPAGSRGPISMTCWQRASTHAWNSAPDGRSIPIHFWSVLMTKRKARRFSPGPSMDQPSGGRPVSSLDRANEEAAEAASLLVTTITHPLPSSSGLTRGSTWHPRLWMVGSGPTMTQERLGRLCHEAKAAEAASQSIISSCRCRWRNTCR